jgi:carboxyl-terminal processing protease
MKHRSVRGAAWSRLLVAPLALTLVSGSLLAGYANGQRDQKRERRAFEMQLVQFDPQNSTHRGNPDRDQDTPPSNPGSDDLRQNAQNGDHPSNADSDPVKSYKTAIELLKKDYYGADIDDKKTQELTYEAIRGMLFSLRDQFTSFLDPDEWNQMQATTHGDFEGIGAMLAEEKPDIKVVEPIETGPAEKVGIKADDVIVRVNDVSVIGKDLNDVVRMIKGAAGTRVKITILRGKETKTFAITRARVEPPVVKYWMEDPKAKIGHILLKEFNEKSMDQMNHAFADLQRQGMRALVFDLRYNPGGLLDVAIDVASVFIPRNTAPKLKNYAVIIHEGSGHEQGRPLQPVDTAYTRHVPTVVLVNENSASASEIVSGAIKDYSVATLIGERTYGKGRVQTLFPLDDGSALRLTTALYFPPKHKDLNFKRDEDGNRIPNTGGILPDLEVKQSDKWKSEDFKDKSNDTQLQVALDFLRARLTGQPVAAVIQQFQNRAASRPAATPDAGRTASAQPVPAGQTKH